MKIKLLMETENRHLRRDDGDEIMFIHTQPCSEDQVARGKALPHNLLL